MSTTGKFLRVQASGGTLGGVQEWTAEDGMDALDATDSDSNGYGDTDVGIQEISGTARGIHDPATDGALAQIAAGTLLTNLNLYGNSTQASPDYSIPSAIITKSSRKVATRGQIEWSFEFKSKGSYTVN